MLVELNILELIPLLEKYRLLYWEEREHELRGYLLHHEMPTDMADDEIDRFWDRFNGRPTKLDPHPAERDWSEHRSDMCRAEVELLDFLRGNGPEEVQRLQEELIEKVGD